MFDFVSSSFQAILSIINNYIDAHKMKPLENGGIVNWTRNQNECIKRHETNLNFDGFPMEYAQKLSLFNIFFLSLKENHVH